VKRKFNAETVGHAYLELLSMRGIDYFFANAGTDFVSIVEAFAHRKAQGKDRPRSIAVPHEIPLVGMAHGYYLVTGRPQAAMVHVNVGTANALGGLMTARHARVPILFSAGRTPITEDGHPGSRSGQIHWGQESFDQGGLVREYVKWDYELRIPSQLETVVDRALAMAMSEPRGPVYLTFPREVMLSSPGEVEFHEDPRHDLPTFYPDPERIQQAADLLHRAKFPLVITSSLGRSPSAVRSLIDLAGAGSIGVISFCAEYMNFPVDHPCYLGLSPAPFFDRADAILVIDCDVPWFPKMFKPKDSAVVIQAGIDPLYSRYPIRSFPSDLTLQGDPALVLSQLTEIIKRNSGGEGERTEQRRTELNQIHGKILNNRQETAMKVAHDSPLDPIWVSYQLNRVLGGETMVVNEYHNAVPEQCQFSPGNYFCSPHAGYLGWSLGTALGIKLASPEKTVIATVGDGTYMFSVPSACHSVSTSYDLPILIIVYNNRCWNAVKRSTRAVFPDGIAAEENLYPLSDLGPTAHYEKICEAFGGYGERVERPDQVGPALDRALQVVRHEKRQALLNMICKIP
jgi:acetolactate synthase-1/2/3 large subunit